MFKKIIILSFVVMSYGCTSNPSTQLSSTNSIKNFNTVQEESLVVSGKKLSFITFKKQEQKIVKEDGATFKETVKDFGSGVQWNEEYVVTAKHVAFVDNSVYKCFEGCDIQFVKRKASSNIPLWRNVISGEQLIFLGVNQENKLLSIHSNDMNIQTYTTSNYTVIANLSDSQVVGGMSGGPAYSSDGKVVGMLTGGTVINNDQNVTVYLEYSAIKAAWELFQANKLAIK